MTRWPIRLSFLMLGLGLSAQAQNTVSRPAPVPEVLADRISMAMRGLPASAEERSQLAAGAATVESLVESYASESSFQDLMTLFWLDKLKINSRVSFADTEITLEGMTTKLKVDQAFKRRDNVNHPRVERLVYMNQPKASGCSPRLEVLPAQNLPPTPAELTRVETNCKNTNLSQTDRDRNCTLATEYRSRIEEYRLFSKVHHCECGKEITVTPFWDPGLSLKACPSVVSAIKVTDADKVPPPQPRELCGINLQRCQPFDPVLTIVNNNFPNHLQMNPVKWSQGSPLAEVAKAVTEEPGRIIATIISERGDFRNVLTETRTRLNGPMESFYLAPVGKSLLAQLPPGTFRQGVDGQWNLDPAAGMREAYRWVDRGPDHAGVLTTWAFQQFTNGYRAKANRVYETFLCQRFIIPPGVSESNVDSQDLLVRQPCASCHVQLEPMGDFFKKWEIEGTNYAYTPSRSSTGRFKVGDQWKDGSEPKGLGTLVGSDPRFAHCAATRAFEFVMGRGPTEFEKTGLISNMSKNFGPKIDFLSAMIAVVSSDSFYRAER